MGIKAENASLKISAQAQGAASGAYIRAKQNKGHEMMGRRMLWREFTTAAVWGRKLSAAAILGIAPLLSGCGGQAGSFADPSDSVATKFGNLLAFNSATAPEGSKTRAKSRIFCPVVQVEPGGSAVRVGGESATSVRYQIAISDVARECDEQGGQLLIKVGVETRTIIGPAGSPGAYTAPLTIGVRRIGDEKIMASRTYTAGGSVGADSVALGQIVSEPLSVPFVNDRADETYEIVLGFGQGAAKRDSRAHRTRR